MLKDGKMRPLKDTIAMCYLYSEAVNINQLFGIEAGGTWLYPSDIAPYVTESTSPTHAGAVVMNGKGIYENVSSLTGNYHGLNNVKIIDFVYKTDINGCLKGKEYKIVIVLTEDITK
jgi:hypothetical protein